MEAPALMFVLGQLREKGQRQLLIASAHARAFKRHRGFATGNQTRGRLGQEAVIADIARNGEEHLGGLARFAGQGRGQRNRIKPKRAGRFAGGGDRSAVSAQDGVRGQGSGGIAGLQAFLPAARRPVLQEPHNGRRRFAAQTIAIDRGQGIGERGGIGHGKARGDGIEPVARYVGQEQIQALGRGEEPQQPPALEARQVLADRIRLVNAGTEASSRPVMSCFSASVSPPAGAGSSAEPPPETTVSTSVSASAACASRAMRRAASSPLASGTGCPASTSSTRCKGTPCPYLTQTRPPEMRVPSRSSSASAMRAEALPAPNTRMRAKALRSNRAAGAAAGDQAIAVQAELACR